MKNQGFRMDLKEKEFEYFNSRKPSKEEMMEAVPFDDEIMEEKFEDLLNHQHAAIGAFFSDGKISGKFLGVVSLCKTVNDLYNEGFIE